MLCIIHGTNTAPHANGYIPTETCLSVTIWHSPGTGHMDLIIVHGISHSETFRFIWMVVDAMQH